MTRRLLPALLAAVSLAAAAPAAAEDGYDLWLRYVRTPGAASLDVGEVRVLGESPTLAAARRELERGLSAMEGAAPRQGRRGLLLAGTSANAQIAALKLPMEKAGDEGYVIRTMPLNGRPATVIAANTDVGVLYGAFAYLRRIQTGQPMEPIDVADRPAVKLRLLNHWDNLDRSVERGYAG